MPMQTGAQLARNKDQKVFTVTLLAHWSEIQADDGEADSVKWGFDNTYVSNKGTYTLLHKCSECRQTHPHHKMDCSQR